MEEGRIKSEERYESKDFSVKVTKSEKFNDTLWRSFK
jgi:hypothetical protein